MVPNINGKNLASKAKGIYKPKDNQFALSVRSSLKWSYEDKLTKNDNGKISLKYFQENKNQKKEILSIQILVEKCIKDKIPIGVL